MFREVIGQVVGTASPVDEKVTMFDAIFNPVKTHIHGFGAALFDRTVGDTCRVGVVSLNGRGRLGVPHVVQDGSQHGRLLTIVE